MTRLRKRDVEKVKGLREEEGSGEEDYTPHYRAEQFS